MSMSSHSMVPVSSTVDLLLQKALGRDIDQRWVDWAVEMMTVGFDGTYLAILAGERAPFQQFQMQELTDKVLSELGLDYSDKDRAIHVFVSARISQALNGARSMTSVLHELRDLHVEIGLDSPLQELYMLACAKAELDSDGVQWYCNGATAENIDDIITEAFRAWVSDT